MMLKNFPNASSAPFTTLVLPPTEPTQYTSAGNIHSSRSPAPAST
ncbi:unnamed protein product [Dibothriocephalus latus]|uniref:Uncharacterized protein n=1 Tax=Dibothriocephalus latus TaxID=60516 RepID=A0A3P7NBT6_DIBLA|nr:unnamed protein product [Dibothriocephalus latus]